MERDLRGTTGRTNRSDYAVAWMLLGESKKAIELLLELEKESPGLYFVAANLGTAYELSGNNREALRWMREAIGRNPESHERTEWLHVMILEAKIRQENEPDYFQKHSVLDLDPNEIIAGTARLPESMSVQKLRHALTHQLSERLQFVKPPDLSVAGLLVDLGAAEAVSGTLESANAVLRMAVQFGTPNPKVQPLIDQFDRTIWWRHARTNAAIAAAGVVFFALLWFLYKKGIFVLRAKSPGL